jgi:mannose-6-phosphate isomerase
MDVMRTDPEGQLGAAVRNDSAMLPFLVKVLAADEPLSLQAHPSAEQALEGYLREDRAGVPLVAGAQLPRPQPQAGGAGRTRRFRGAGGIPPGGRFGGADAGVGGSDLEPFIALLTGQSDADGLRALFTTWITSPQPDLDILIPAVLEGAVSICVPAQRHSAGGQGRPRTRRALPRRRRCAGVVVAQPDRAAPR